MVEYLTDKGYELVLATAPLFPWQATHERIRWAGLEPAHFKTITTYERCRYTKPHLSYYKNLLEEIGREAEECLMVGNDVDEDLAASEVGMQTFLVDEMLINPSGKPIACLGRGSLAQCADFLEKYVRKEN